jgi:4'-phosphopantetheinyl transferase
MRTEGQWSIESAHGPGEYPEEGSVDVWLCSCGAPADVLRVHLETFDMAEKTRAASFRVESAWSAFVARRAMVRMVSARYLGLPRDSIAWETSPLGKPFLRSEAGEGGLEISWSQGGSAVVLAVARGIAVGVDACQETEGASLDGLVDVFCSEDEVSALASMSGLPRRQALVQCWTAKEACLKAAGTGLHCDPRRLRTWGNGRPLDTVAWTERTDVSSGWHMDVAHRRAAGGIALAVATPVPLELAMHGLVWTGGDRDGIE